MSKDIAIRDRKNADVSESTLNDLLCGKTFELVVVSGVEGPSVYLDDYRIAGNKPWGGGNVTHRFKARGEDILTAIDG